MGDKSLGNKLDGAGQLSVDAVLGVLDLVEEAHQSVLSMGGLLNRGDLTRTSGMTGSVYQKIRQAAGLAGYFLESLLAQISPKLKDLPDSARREALIAVINGVVGDHLARSANPLAVTMHWSSRNKFMTDDGLADLKRQTKVILFIHGSCMNDSCWQRSGYDYGRSLAEAYGYQPIYLNYNSGLHISENGRELAMKLAELLGSGSSIKELGIVGHSMGGLVARSACYYGAVFGHSWLQHLKTMIFLGTPHHGAPLEKIGNQLNSVFQCIPHAAPFTRLSKIRSAGVTDLRYGNIKDQDWQGVDRFARRGDRRQPVKLPQDVLCLAIAATVSQSPKAIGDLLLGDGLVTVQSALGRHPRKQKDLGLPPSHQQILRGCNHMDLLGHREVLQTLLKWFADLACRA